MKYFSLLSLFLFLFSGGLRAQQTEILMLSGADKEHTVTWDFFCTHGMNSGKWSKIEVPSNWEFQGFGSYLYGDVNRKANEQGLYRHTFSVPAAWREKKVFIVFEGSMTDTEVKINGKPAGPIHQGAFYPFWFDISALLQYGKENLLEVTVSKESTNESVNRAERISDYWVFGGIFRPVYLEARPARYIERVAVDARADGSFYMDLFLGGTSGGSEVEVVVESLDGKRLGKPLKATVQPDSEKVTLRGTFANPALWNPESPRLYKAVVTLKEANKPMHQYNQRFGFRTVEFRPSDGFYVNGTKVLFKGVCRHTFHPSSGRTSSKQISIDEVLNIKAMNMNAVRMSHYPPDRHFLDVCDSLGLFVLDELAGWQKFYDTPTARRLVKRMVERDVNHPSIVIWDNGNEGGFNKEVRDDYMLYDPQKRVVIEPWSIVNGTNTKHYPKYKYVKDVLNNRKEVYFPTEFLHGLFDGGHGAGLDDYWNLMLSKPLAAGGFLWVYADEGAERRDLNDSIDTNGNRAPDGIVGPYGQKEGSFYTIREIWSAVQFDSVTLTPSFNGKLPITNRYHYTSLQACRFVYRLAKFSLPFWGGQPEVMERKVPSPRVAPGEKGYLSLSLPRNWSDWDVLYIDAFDPENRPIHTWSWNITSPRDMAARLLEFSGQNESVTCLESDTFLTLSAGGLQVRFSKANGQILGAAKGNGVVSLSRGPQFAGFDAPCTGIRHYREGTGYVVELLYAGANRAKWTLRPDGWLQLDYAFEPTGRLDYAGITFSYPETEVFGAGLMANGPFRVWKNRLKGPQFGLYQKTYNNTVTGESWDYPEFKGYYSNFYAVRLKTGELPLTLVSATESLYLHLFTPQKPRYAAGGVHPPFPSGSLSVLHGISPIGTKFSQAYEEGPQGAKYDFGTGGEKFEATLYFGFGK